jgi:hypothetical protein
MATKTQTIEIHGIQVTLKTWDEKQKDGSTKYFGTAEAMDKRHDVGWDANSDSEEVVVELITQGILGYVESYAKGEVK